MPQSGIFDPFASLARNKRETRFSYHRGDIIYCFILTDRLLCDIMTFMKPKPYSESQLNRFMDKMGDAFDYAINDCKIDGTEFVKMFVADRKSVV